MIARVARPLGFPAEGGRSSGPRAQRSPDRADGAAAACARPVVTYGEGVRLALASLVVVLGLVTSRPNVASAGVSSLSPSAVTVYGARWCSACRSLEAGLRERKIAFDVVDVDDNAAAFARARAESGAGGAIPLTGVVRASNTVWIVGADVDAVDRAQRGE